MGGGKRNNFGNTEGNFKFISKVSEVRYNENKMSGYLLNRNHPQGHSKAKFLDEVLGYKVNDAKKLHKNIVKSIIGMKPSNILVSKFGTKYIFNTKLQHAYLNNYEANIVVVIQKDIKRVTYKIVTIYPDKEEI